jgi:hypothetical protein
MRAVAVIVIALMLLLAAVALLSRDSGQNLPRCGPNLEGC